MAISRARKLRDKQIREGKLDPAIKRKSWDGVQPATKSTPTLQEKKEESRTNINGTRSRIRRTVPFIILHRLLHPGSPRAEQAGYERLSNGQAAPSRPA